jgi:HEAT repeat protein
LRRLSLEFQMAKKTLLVAAMMLLATVQQAQGYITEAEKKKRREEVAALAAQLLTKDTHERLVIRDEMIKKDAFRDGDKVVQDGFAVDGFVWLYKEGLTRKDVNARLNAVMGLASLEASAARDPLARMLEDPSDGIQLRVIQAIDRKAIVSAGKAVVQKLRSSNPEIIAAAARCLADMNYGGSGEATGPMIELLVQWYDKLVKTPVGDPAGAECNRLIEILGRSAGQLIGGMDWAPGPTRDDLGKEIAKFAQWWNQKHLGSMRDPRYDVRRDALAGIRTTADKSCFFPVLEAVARESARLRDAQSTFTDKQQAQLFIAEASTVLSRISGNDATRLSNPTAQDIQSAMTQWSNWWDGQVKQLASPPY